MATTETRLTSYGAQSMIGSLEWVLMHRPADEYTSAAWEQYGLGGQPDLQRAQTQHDAFADLLRDRGVEVSYLEEHTSIQTTAVFDPVLITEAGAVMLRSGRPERRVEMLPMARRIDELGIPILGWVGGAGEIDGGDTLWLDERTLLVGHGYRTNESGVRQLRQILDGVVDQIITFDNPHYHGAGQVLHLMSYVSLVSETVAVTFSELMPVRLRKLLLERGYDFVEVPAAEFATEAGNVLAIEPGVAVVVDGNPVTAAGLRERGIEVLPIAGDELCVKRVSGPTCNTRPLRRAAL